MIKGENALLPCILSATLDQQLNHLYDDDRRFPGTCYTALSRPMSIIQMGWYEPVGMINSHNGQTVMDNIHAHTSGDRGTGCMRRMCQASDTILLIVVPFTEKIRRAAVSSS